MKQLISIGLYRHFKGEYYYVTGLAKSTADEKTVMVYYFNVCHPEYGSFVRPLDDFVADHDTTEHFGDEMTLYIKDRKDNKTGQIKRFERVKDLNFQIGSISTEQLIEELRRRTDSPIHELDIEGLQSKVFSKDYVVGEAYEQTDTTEKGVYTVSVHDTPEKAQEYLATHVHKINTKVFKRTFIEL